METRRIGLRDRKGKVIAFTTVSAQDYEDLNQHRWYLHPLGYVTRMIRPDGGKQRLAYMHREILGLTPGDGKQADHINCNKKDNRRENLRVVDHLTNAHNHNGWRKATSKFRGVSWDKRSGKWRAKASIKGVCTNLGYHEDELHAARLVREFREQNAPVYRAAV